MHSVNWILEIEHDMYLWLSIYFLFTLLYSCVFMLYNSSLVKGGSVVKGGSDVVWPLNCENERDGVEGPKTYSSAHNAFMYCWFLSIKIKSFLPPTPFVPHLPLPKWSWPDIVLKDNLMIWDLYFTCLPHAMIIFWLFPVSIVHFHIVSLW